jgi:hypothetical protein
MKINRFCIKIFGLVCSKWNYLVNLEVYAGGKGPAAEMRHGAVNNLPPALTARWRIPQSLE